MPITPCKNPACKHSTGYIGRYESSDRYRGHHTYVVPTTLSSTESSIFETPFRNLLSELFLADDHDERSGRIADLFVSGVDAAYDEHRALVWEAPRKTIIS